MRRVWASARAWATTPPAPPRLRYETKPRTAAPKQTAITATPRATWTDTIAPTLARRRAPLQHGRRRQARADLHSSKRLRRGDLARVASRQAGRLVLLPPRRHAGLHPPGVRNPRRLGRVREARRGRSWRQP